MNAEWIEQLSMGAGVAILASAALLFMVYRELTPSGGLSGRGRVLLTVGVGLGVLSFATKVAALPELTLAPLSSLRKVERPENSGPRPVWPMCPVRCLTTPIIYGRACWRWRIRSGIQRWFLGLRHSPGFHGDFRSVFIFSRS